MSSSKTDCKAMLRLHRALDNGWVVVEHNPEHNHPLSETCGEKKHWPSHHHLDKYTKDLVRMLRENNIGITKLYTILGTFFWINAECTCNQKMLENSLSED